MPGRKITIVFIVNTYYQKIFKLSLFHLRDKQESEEITQDIFFKITKKLPFYKGQADIYTWIYRIAINTVINHIKRKKRVQFLSLERISEGKEPVHNRLSGDPALRTEKNETLNIKLKQLEHAIQFLSNRQRTAFYLFYYESLSQKQIAGVMKTSVSAVESMVHKAKKNIKKRLNR
jgi:RNA polymerase sigma-70 factor (ECF subfamily)